MGAIQLAIMLGGAFGGLLFDHISAASTLLGGTLLLVLASWTVWNGHRIRPDVAFENGSSSVSLELSYRPAVSLCESGD